jgi:hypothetical protein
MRREWSYEVNEKQKKKLKRVELELIN